MQYSERIESYPLLVKKSVGVHECTRLMCEVEKPQCTKMVIFEYSEQFFGTNTRQCNYIIKAIK